MIEENYDDIIRLPHPVSPRHKPMSMWQRAAQFAPFAALTGFDAAIDAAAATAFTSSVEYFDCPDFNPDI